MSDTASDAIVHFVEGRLSPADFEGLLRESSILEAALADDPTLPARSYVGRSVYLYLLELDLADPGGVLDAQGALSEWLTRHSIAHSKAKDAQAFYDLLLAAQPKWLDVDTKWLQDEIVAKAGDRRGDALRAWLHEQLVARFRYVPGPPSWIQSPSWPIGPNGPLVFLGQIEVPNYFHDVAVAYVFHDPTSNECTTVIQVA